jgi:hypothetical protein
MLKNLKCNLPTCGKTIEAFIGFKKRMAKFKEGDSTGKWWVEEDQIDGIAVGETDEKFASVVTLLLDEDRVSRLHGAEV